MEVYLTQIEEIAARANAWLDFAIVCGWIGFGFSMLALLILVWMKWRERHD